MLGIDPLTDKPINWETETRRIWMTLSKEKTLRGYLAVILLGSPQAGDAEAIILDANWMPNMKAAKAWFRRLKETRPWETRN